MHFSAIISWVVNPPIKFTNKPNYSKDTRIIKSYCEINKFNQTSM